MLIPEPTIQRRRPVALRFDAAKLVLCIALGLWLGLVAAGLTGWIAYKALFGAEAPVAEAVGPVERPTPAAPAQPPQPALAPDGSPAPATNAIPSNDAMFDRYQQNLRNQQLQQIEQAARANPGNLNNAKCQFWLQQAQTAPTQKSRESVAQFCE